MKKRSILLVVILSVAGLGLLYLSKVKSSGSSETVVASLKLHNELGVTSDSVISEFLANIPATRKPVQVEIEIDPIFPSSFDEMVVVSPNSRLGPEGFGAGCRVPEYSQDGKKVKIVMYATVSKLKQELGDENAISTINNIFRKCLRWGMWSKDRKAEDFPALTQDTSSGTDQILLKLP